MDSKILSWDTYTTQEDMAEIENCGIEDLDVTNIQSQLEFEWEMLCENLTVILNAKSEDGYWYAEVENFGWQNLDGCSKFEIKDGRDMIQKILPNCEKTFHIYDKGDNRLSINCFHHDSPTGEWYFLRPISSEEYESKEEGNK